MQYKTCYVIADNISYGASPGDSKVAEEDVSLLEASTYEVLVSVTQSSGGNIGHEYEQTGSTYAGAMVINVVIDMAVIQLAHKELLSLFTNTQEI